jgi:hypothetical protein
VTPPPDEQLHQLAYEAVRYEMNELITCDHLLPTLRSTKAKNMMWNMVLEAFVIHARNQVDFFYERSQPHPSDVYAALYVKEWPDLRPAKSELLKETKKRADKQLAHLTVERIELSSQSWDHQGITRELVALYQRFLEALPQDRRSWFGLEATGS